MQGERIPTRANPIVEVGTVREFYEGKVQHYGEEPHQDVFDQQCSCHCCPYCGRRISVVNGKVYNEGG